MPCKKLSAKVKDRVKHAQLSWTLSRFLHGQPAMSDFRQFLFMRVVPNVMQMGLTPA